MVNQLGVEEVAFLGLFDTYPSVDMIINSEIKFNQNDAVELIVSYYLQEIQKLIDKEIKIDLKNISGIHPARAIDQILQIVRTREINKIQHSTDFIEQFTEIFKTVKK